MLLVQALLPVTLLGRIEMLALRAPVLDAACYLGGLLLACLIVSLYPGACKKRTAISKGDSCCISELLWSRNYFFILNTVCYLFHVIRF